MSDMITNDNEVALAQAGFPEPDAHGQAAMLLTESLLHGLIARKLFSVRDAVEIVEVASEVKEAVAEDMGDSPATMQRSLALLCAIRASLTNDLIK
jgi:hypothetical protein